jgi:hypothetical protein
MNKTFKKQRIKKRETKTCRKKKKSNNVSLFIPNLGPPKKMSFGIKKNLGHTNIHGLKP